MKFFKETRRYFFSSKINSMKFFGIHIKKKAKNALFIHSGMKFFLPVVENMLYFRGSYGRIAFVSGCR